MPRLLVTFFFSPFDKEMTRRKTQKILWVSLGETWIETRAVGGRCLRKFSYFFHRERERIKAKFPLMILFFQFCCLSIWGCRYLWYSFPTKMSQLGKRRLLSANCAIFRFRYCFALLQSLAKKTFGKLPLHFGKAFRAKKTMVNFLHT